MQRGKDCPPEHSGYIAEQDETSGEHASCDAYVTRSDSMPTDLARVSEAWNDLPEHIRQTILTLVEGVNCGRE